MLCRFSSQITSIFALKSVFKRFMTNSVNMFEVVVFRYLFWNKQFLLSSEMIKIQQCVDGADLIRVFGIMPSPVVVFVQ